MHLRATLTVVALSLSAGIPAGHGSIPAPAVPAAAREPATRSVLTTRTAGSAFHQGASLLAPRQLIHGVDASGPRSSGLAPRPTASETTATSATFAGPGKAGDAAAGSAAATSFGAPVSLPAGTHTHGVTVADLNGDGKLDLVAANAGSSTASVWLGNGDGTFGSRADFPTGLTPKMVAVGDMNGDGIPDLVTANQDDASVSVLLGNGAGAFGPKADYRACSGTHEVALGDLNGDGKLDVVAACWGGSVASVLLGNGDGTLRAKVDYDAGVAPHSVVLGQFNSDGFLDAAIADHGSNAVSVLLGNGDGTFQTQVTYPVGTGPHSVRAGDLNGDGKIDLVTANETSSDVSVLLGNADGTFQPAVNYPTGSVPKGVAIADVSGDGHPDVITADTAGNYPTCCHPGGDLISVLLGSGTGTLGPPTPFQVGLTPFAVSTGDLDRDGDLDVVTANWDSGNVTVLLNTTSGGTTDTTPPTGSFSINGGASSTTSPLVTLADTATDDATGVSSVRVSNDGSTWATYAYVRSLQWDVTDPSSGGDAATGLKTVTMEWQDGAGNWSAPSVQSITLLAGSTYHPLSPARILDTRIGLGLPGTFRSHLARTFQVTGQGGVPSGAVAVTGNLTVTGQTAAGYLYLGPDPVNNPTSSTLNFPLGDNRANGVTVALGASGTPGSLSITYVAGPSTARTQVIFDVTGYFTADTTGATYHPIVPGRVLFGTFQSHVARIFQVTGQGGVPSGATAVTGNLTVTGQTAPGYLYLGPDHLDNPTSSTLNFPLGDNRANGVTVALRDSGGLSATYVAASSTATTRVIFDVTGYFTADATGATYHALGPGRVLDTRIHLGVGAALSSGVPARFPVTGVGPANVPSDAVAVTGNLTVTGQSRAGYVALGPVQTASPPTSMLNFPARDTRANGLTVQFDPFGGLWAVYISGRAGDHTALIFDVTGYFQ